MASRRQLIANAFKAEDREFRHGYVESFLSTRLALQIRSNRKARGWTQKRLADEAGLHQSQIPELEDIDNETWTINKLLKIAAAFDLVLVVKLESFGNALPEFASVAPEELVRPSFPDDPGLSRTPSPSAKGSLSFSFDPDPDAYLPADDVTIQRVELYG